MRLWSLMDEVSTPPDVTSSLFEVMVTSIQDWLFSVTLVGKLINWVKLNVVQNSKRAFASWSFSSRLQLRSPMIKISRPLKRESIKTLVKLSRKFTGVLGGRKTVFSRNDLQYLVFILSHNCWNLWLSRPAWPNKKVKIRGKARAVQTVIGRHDERLLILHL